MRNQPKGCSARKWTLLISCNSTNVTKKCVTIVRNANLAENALVAYLKCKVQTYVPTKDVLNSVDCYLGKYLFIIRT